MNISKGEIATGARKNLKPYENFVDFHANNFLGKFRSAISNPLELESLTRLIAIEETEKMIK